MPRWTADAAWTTALTHLQGVRENLIAHPGRVPGPGVFIMHGTDESEKRGIAQRTWDVPIRRNALVQAVENIRKQVPTQYVMAMAPTVDAHGNPQLYATFDGPGVSRRVILYAGLEWSSVADELEISELTEEDAVLPNLSGRLWEQ